MVHVFALMLYVGGKLIEPPMYFKDIETCNYYARETVRRYGLSDNSKHFGTAYCVPEYVNLEETKVY